MIITTITPTVQVSAVPSNQEVQQSRDKYEELKAKVNEVNQKVQEFDDQISQLTIKVDGNNNQISNINKEVEGVNKEIDVMKTDMSGKEEVLGKRLREVYKSGGQTNYISLIASADSFSDLISRIDTAVRLVNMDQKVVQELLDNKSKLDEKVDTLATNASQIQSINDEIQVQKAELSQKKTEQQNLVDQAKTEEDNFNKQFLTPMEREVAQGFMDVANNKDSTVAQLNDAVSTLTAIRGQTKSAVVINEIDTAIKAAKKTISLSKTPGAANRGVVASGNAGSLLSYAYTLLGRPYVWGAKGPNSFDCSGFTSYVYRNVMGIEIGASTYEQINAGVEVSQSELQPGDLVFPHSGHVAIYVGNGQMIHAPRTGDVIKIGPVYAFWRARRILK
ncbi:NlpC/P60 family protein [Clostridium sp. SHJSY1]|nr:NlpC/P60 family protein [Clostridium sp. SHJSY1]